MVTTCANCGKRCPGFGTRVVCSLPCMAALEKQDHKRLGNRSQDWVGYPAGWPTCVYCPEPAMDGHLTCGKVTCCEVSARTERGFA